MSAPLLGLHSGLLYNIVIDLLVFTACFWSAYLIYDRGKEKIYSLFLFLLGLFWLVDALANFLGWLKLLKQAGFFAVGYKLFLALPPLVLIYFLADRSFKNKLIVKAAAVLFSLIALYYLVTAGLLDGNTFSLTYWGVQWPNSFPPLLIIAQGLLCPALLGAMFVVLANALSAYKKQRTTDLTVYWGAIIYALVQFSLVLPPQAGWQGMLAKLFFILTAFGGYNYYAGRYNAERLVPRGEVVAEPPRRRRPLFTKLLLLFICFSVVPLIIFSLLTFISFKEIVNPYIYRPLLGDLKTSREAFLQSLGNVQVQALALLALTVLLTSLAAAVVSRNLAESLSRLRRAMARVAKGDFRFRLLPDSNDELGDVVGYFNALAGEIKKAREIMENWNRELETKVKERTEELQALFDIAKAIGSSLDLELLVQRTMGMLGVENYALLNPDQTVRFAAGPAEGRQNAPTVPIKVKGSVVGSLVVAAGREQARKTTLLKNAADQLAIAFENVGIYEKEKEAVARLTELDRLKNEFISMVSHELRTPVTAADGYVSLFLAGVTGPISDDQKKYLTIVKENNQRLLALINRLLDFSRIETGRFSIQRELISINDVIDRAITEMTPQLAKKRAQVKLRLEAKQPNFMGDREKLVEVFTNLIENALKFSRENVTPELEIMTKDAGDFLEVSVRDNGPGIAAEYREKIFNKFFQIEDTMTRKAGGVGLGLAIVKEIISNHHGKIWVESAGQDQGANFIFQLPVAEKV